MALKRDAKSQYCIYTTLLPRLNRSHQPTAVYISGLDQPPATLAAAAAPHRLVALQGQLAVGDVQAIRRGGEGVVR